MSKAPSPIVKGLSFRCTIVLLRFNSIKSTPVPSANTGLFTVVPKFPPTVVATAPNQTSRRPQKMFVTVSGCKEMTRVLSVRGF